MLSWLDPLLSPAARPAADQRSPGRAAPARPAPARPAGAGLGNAGRVERLRAQGGLGAPSEVEALNFEQSEAEHRSGMWRDRPRAARAANGEEVLTDDIRLERLAGAQSLSYKAPADYTDADRETLTDSCYAADPAAYHSSPSGLQSTLFLPDLSRPECADTPPVVATRGTEGVNPMNPETQRDWWANMSGRGIGRDAYAESHLPIREQLRQGKAATGQQPTLAGHSQGGALAQLAAVHNPDLVGRVVGYSSPGIQPDEATAFNREQRGRVPVTYYGGDLDPVPNTGMRALSGEVHEVDRPLLDREEGWNPLKLAGAPFADHTTPLLQDLERSAVRERPTHWSEDSTVPEAARQVASTTTVGVYEALYGGPAWQVERPEAMDARMREAHHRDWDETEIPKGVPSAAELEEAQRILSAHNGQGEVEWIRD
jgi:pimeloyl-ACP methyl ester carboxylesterase